jgi:hypothetical protein
MSDYVLKSDEVMTPSELGNFVKKREAKKSTILIPGILNRQAVTLFYGRYHSHKTYFSVWLAQNWAAGVEIPHFDIEDKMRVLYLNYETPAALFFKRWEVTRKALDISKKALDKRCRICRYQFDFSESKRSSIKKSSYENELSTSTHIEDERNLEDAINETEADIIIIDSLKSYVKSPLDIAAALRMLTQVANRYNAAFWVIHHENEEKFGEGKVFGGSIRNYPNTVIHAVGWRRKGADTDDRGIGLRFDKTTKKQIDRISFKHEKGHVFVENEYSPSKNSKKRKSVKSAAPLTKKDKIKGRIKKLKEDGVKKTDILNALEKEGIDRNYAGKILRGDR